MLPQIKFAIENEMSCMIINHNYEKDEDDRKVEPRIASKEKHCTYAFKKFVINRCIADEVFIGNILFI